MLITNVNTIQFYNYARIDYFCSVIELYDDTGNTH